ncbi:nucleotide exchange factor GrpE [Candidatus Parcubacteria bacterium]|nr:nucleotide exchange factor GrpE [Candidatus Parcubacteria bacterium]
MSNEKKEKIKKEKPKTFAKKIAKEVKEVEELKKQVEENLIGWQRAQADMANYKKEQEKHLSEFRKYANEDMILNLLPTIDSFALATNYLPEDLKDSDWVKGILCIKGQFDGFLKEAGVEEIRSLGEKFDPSLFESVGEEESDKEEGTVIVELQKGYKMSGKIIRPAKVRIAKKNQKDENDKEVSR